MWELRWILLGLGVFLVGVVYLWSCWRARAGAVPPVERVEPGLSEEPAVSGGSGQDEAPKSSPPPNPDRIITLRLVGGSATDLNCEDLVVGLRAVGLRHGRYGIFHRHADDDSTSEPLFSVANLVEPGSFDLTTMTETTLPGVSFFLLLPCPTDAVAVFDDMVETARGLAKELDADLFDDRGSSWSIQRERYLREEIIEYRRQKGLI